MLVTSNRVSIRPIQKDDFKNIIDYFLNAEDNFLLGMGVDKRKLPTREAWMTIFEEEYVKAVEKKKAYYLIWLLNGKAIGHSNINKIVFGQQAFMHLHIWDPENRKKGIGFELIKMSVPFYFDIFRLRKLYCEPHAFNPGPNRTLEKVGFAFVKQYETTPGWINLQQIVNQWVLDVERYSSLSLR